MAQEIRDVVFNIQVRTEDGAVKIDGLTRGFVKAETAFKKMQSTLGETNKAISQAGISTGLANTAILEFGRTMSDAPYGIQGMGNNISQLVSILGQMSQSAKEGGSVLKSLRTAFIGPLGVVVAVQIAVAALEIFMKTQRGVKKETEDLKKSIDEINDSYGGQLAILEALGRSAIYSPEARQAFAENMKEVKEFLEAAETVGDVTAEVVDEAIRLGMKLLEARRKAAIAQKEYLELIKQENLSDEDRISAGTKLAETLKQVTIAQNALKLEKQEDVEVTGKIIKRHQEEIEVLDTLGTTYQRAAEFRKMMADIGFDLAPPDKQLKDSAEKAVDDFQKYTKARAAGRETEEENEVFLRTFGLTKDNFELALGSAVEMSGIINGVLQSEADRSLAIEQNKTNALNDQLKQRLANEELSAEERDKINQQISRNEIALVQRSNEINKKRFQQEKAFSIAQATINTYLAASDVLAREKGGLAAKIIGMTVVIASGLAQVAAISRQQFTGRALPRPRLVAQGGGPAESQSPAFNIVGASGQSQLAQLISGQTGQPIKAYVVAGEVTTAQSLERNKIAEASI
jgi:hypothetical protein